MLTPRDCRVGGEQRCLRRRVGHVQRVGPARLARNIADAVDMLLDPRNVILAQGLGATNEHRALVLHPLEPGAPAERKPHLGRIEHLDEVAARLAFGHHPGQAFGLVERRQQVAGNQHVAIGADPGRARQARLGHIGVAPHLVSHLQQCDTPHGRAQACEVIVGHQRDSFAATIQQRGHRQRHHRGALTTIPFGEIQVVENFSRDWAMMKLAFRVTYDTDVEKMRKIIKKYGQRLMEDEEYGPMFLQPLKSQGILSMEDSAMVARVKFMTKPGKQFILRKVVYAGLQDLFRENGIKFAHRQVTVHVASDQEGEGGDKPNSDAMAKAAAAGAAASGMMEAEAEAAAAAGDGGNPEDMQ